MKIKLISSYNNGVLIQIPYSVLDKLNWKAGDTVEIDIPMIGGGLRIDKVVSQRTGDETI